jgi:hypothetical protein
MMEFVSWDHCSQLLGKIKSMFQTTNQMSSSNKITHQTDQAEKTTLVSEFSWQPGPPSTGDVDPVETLENVNHPGLTI